MNRKQGSYAKKRRSINQKRILLLVCTILILSFALNLQESRAEDPLLRPLDLSESKRQALMPEAENLSFETFSYHMNDVALLRVSCYRLDLESGAWRYQRGSAVQLPGDEGKLSFAFDGRGRKLWAAIFGENDFCFAQINPEEQGQSLSKTSTFWWRKEHIPLEEGLEFALAVQTIFQDSAPEGAEAIDPRETHDTAAIRARGEIAEAYALTICFLPAEQQPFAAPDADEP